MTNLPEQTEMPTIGWIGCVPVIPNDDPDMMVIKTKYDQGERSQSMQKSSCFDDWVRYCAAVSSEIILRMMTSVDPGEAPPNADVICEQIKQSQQQCMALFRPEANSSKTLRAD